MDIVTGQDKVENFEKRCRTRATALGSMVSENRSHRTTCSRSWTTGATMKSVYRPDKTKSVQLLVRI